MLWHWNPPDDCVDRKDGDTDVPQTAVIVGTVETECKVEHDSTQVSAASDHSGDHTIVLSLDVWNKGEIGSVCCFHEDGKTKHIRICTEQSLERLTQPWHRRGVEL